MNSVHSACLRGESTLLRHLLSNHKDLLDLPDSSGNTPLHIACNVKNMECVKELVTAGARVNAVNKDAIHHDGEVESGGRSPLHCAAVAGSGEIIAYLLQHGANANLDDLDSYTPFELYFAHPDHNHSTLSSSLSTSLISQFTPTKDLETARIQRKDVLRARKVEKKQQLREYVAARYTPKFPEIFSEWRDDMFDAKFLELSKLKACPLESLRGIVDEIAPRVYAFNLFSMDYCRKMLEELENFEKTGLPQSRPNSMNNYGVILDDIGFNEVMQKLVLEYIKPIAGVLYNDFGGGSLDSHHAFMVRYKLGEDLDLKTHVDDAEITINVCLGKIFTGSSLYFKGFPGKPNKENILIEYTHKVGTALIHCGKHVHGVHPLQSGERNNLIVWCRSQSYRQNR